MDVQADKNKEKNKDKNKEKGEEKTAAIGQCTVDLLPLLRGRL